LVADWAPSRSADRATDVIQLSPTIDWAGAGLVTTAPELTSFVRGLWSWQILRCFDVGSDTFSREAGAFADRLPHP